MQARRLLLSLDILPTLILLCLAYSGETCFTQIRLPEPRATTCIVEVDNKIYFAGGVNTTAVPSSQIDIFDTVTGTWSTTHLPVPRQEITCNAVGRYIVFSHGTMRRSQTYQFVDVFDTVSQTFTGSLPIWWSNLLHVQSVGPFVIFRYTGQAFVFLDPSNSSIIRATFELAGAKGWVGNSTHLFGITQSDQTHLHQVNLDTLTVAENPTFSLPNIGPLPQRYHLLGNHFVLMYFRQMSVFTLGRSDWVNVPSGLNNFSPLFHDSTMYLVQSTAIITYHPLRGAYRYDVPQELFPITFYAVAHDRTLYISGTQFHIATVRLDGLLQHSDGGPFTFQRRDIGFSSVAAHPTWINLRTQRVQEQPDLIIPPQSYAVDLQNYQVFSSGNVFEISTETWMFIENPFCERTRVLGAPNFNRSMALFGLSLNGIYFITWQAADKTWSVYGARHLNFAEAYSTQDKIVLIDNSGRVEVIDMKSNTSTLFHSQLKSSSRIVTEELVILAGGNNSTTGVSTDAVFIYNARTGDITYGRLSTAGHLLQVAQSKTHAFFVSPLTPRIDTYNLADATWSYIDMPPHFSNDGAAIEISDLKYLVLRRLQRFDIFDMSTEQWRVLAGPPIEGLPNIHVRGSKILFSSGHAAVIYEITTGDWMRIEGDQLSDFQFTDSFFICQNGNTTLYRPLALMTNRILSVSNYERQMTEFDAGITGSVTASEIDWQHNGVSLNVSNSRLTLDSLQWYNNGEYSIIVTDQCNQRMKQSAQLSVIPRPTFTRPLEDSINLCHQSVVIETEIKGETSLEWTINGEPQVTTIRTMTIQPERLACNVKHQLCLKATNPSGSNQTCAELRLLDHDAVFDGPRPMVDRSTWFLESQATLQIYLPEKDCTRHWWLVDGVALDLIDSRQSTLSVNITTLSSYTQYAIRAQCGSSVVQSKSFTFSNVSTIKEWHLALIIPGIVIAIAGAIVTVFLFRRRLKASEFHEMELQNLLTQAKSESLTRDGVSVIPSTTWEWTPTDEFKYKPLDALPCSISASSLQIFKNDTVKVDTWTQAEIEISLKSKGGNADGALKERLIDGVHVDIYTPKSPKYDVKVEPAAFTLKQGKSVLVTVSTMMRMTAKCKICLVIVIEQQQLYSILEYKIASAMSTWIDLEEVEMSNDFLGAGGFGTVVRGVYRGEEVAVKKLLNQFMAEDVKQEFEREITLMKDLRHPNIVQFVGASNIKDNLAILIEYAPYGSLSSVIQKSKLSYSMKIAILVETAKALQFLHLNRIIHRDIKPQNILVFSLEPKSAVHVKLTDFGTSRFISDTTVTVTKNVGTTLYMAPEALGKNPRIDKSADIYSFGILMWELLYECQPFTEYEWQSDVENHVKKGGRLPLDKTRLNPELIKLIEDCWKHDPSTRPSISEVVQRLSEQT